jgi:hypothetical protein
MILLATWRDKYGCEHSVQLQPSADPKQIAKAFDGVRHPIRYRIMEPGK